MINSGRAIYFYTARFGIQRGKRDERGST